MVAHLAAALPQPPRGVSLCAEYVCVKFRHHLCTAVPQDEYAGSSVVALAMCVANIELCDCVSSFPFSTCRLHTRPSVHAVAVTPARLGCPVQQCNSDMRLHRCLATPQWQFANNTNTAWPNNANTARQRRHTHQHMQQVSSAMCVVVIVCIQQYRGAGVQQQMPLQALLWRGSNPLISVTLLYVDHAAAALTSTHQVPASMIPAHT